MDLIHCASAAASRRLAKSGKCCVKPQLRVQVDGERERDPPLIPYRPNKQDVKLFQAI